LLLYNELAQNSPYLTILRRIAESEQASLIDSSQIIGDSRVEIERQMETRFGLSPPVGVVPVAEANRSEVIFRVFLSPEYGAGPVFLNGPYEQLGNAEPNRQAMFDDGTHGDQKAADQVWTLTANFPPTTSVYYTYTNNGRPGFWENLDVPMIRTFTTPSNSPGPYFRPIESFGRVYAQADGTHPTAQGYDLIAGAIIKALNGTRKFRAFVEGG
jgi:hypothetical protein